MADDREYLIREMPTDLGVKLYPVDEAKEKKSSADKPWRSPTGIFLLAVLAFLVFWFFYSFIYALVHENASDAITSHLGGLFALLVCGAIIIFSVFKLWVKFGGWALSRGLVKRRDAAQVRQQVEIMEGAYKEAEAAEPFIEVYRDYVIATDKDGVVKIFDAGKLSRVDIYRYGTIYNLALKFSPFGYEFLKVSVTKREIEKLQRVFGEKAVFVSADSAKRGGVNPVSLAMGALCLAVGGGVIAVHYCLSANIPVALGAFFMAAGVLVFFFSFGKYPVVKVFLIPLAFGIIFVIFPPAFGTVIAEEQGLSLPSDIGEFLTSFSAVYCILAFFCAIGVMCIISAFTGLVKYLENGEY